MNKTELFNKVTRTLNKTGLKLKKHSPEILIVGGIIGTVASTVMACKATTKLGDILEDAKNNISDIHDAIEHPELLPAGAEYTLEDSKKDLAIVYTKTGLEVVKLYAPSVITGVLSLTAIVTSNRILRTRNVALAAAYATIEKSFKEYRGRVVERFGAEMDRELKYNIKAKEFEEVVTNEDGTEVVTTKTVATVDPSTIDDTSRIWYEGNPGFSRDPEFNLMYLKRQQAYATEKLKAQGSLTLNEVYDLLGYKRTKQGAMIGWIYDEKNPVGDNFVDFGLYNRHDKQNIAFINGDETAVLLEFNHDGNILEKL